MTGPPMIFRKMTRALTDGCIYCGLSRTYCEARSELQSERCCPRCADSKRDSH